MKHFIRRGYDKIYNLIMFKLYSVKCGKNMVINGRIRISNNIEFGDNVTINSGKHYNKIGGQTYTSMITNKNGRIVIGNNVGISNSSFFSMNSIIIGNNVMIGGSCKIYDTDFHSIVYDDRINGNINIKTSPLIIKDGAWIGGHCIILKGVTIGYHSVVAAGSVVTKSIPDNEVWGGNPAHFIKKIK